MLRDSATFEDAVAYEARTEGPVSAPEPEAQADPVEPIGDVGALPAPVCRCGAGPHPELEGRCAAGHVGRNNGLALVVGAASRVFWAEHEAARREIRQAVIADAGYMPEDAPRALRIAAESIAQATLIRDSAYLRLAEARGPLASSGRVRRAFHAWVQASDRLERSLRLVGLRRVPRRVPSLDEALAAVDEDEGRDA